MRTQIEIHFGRDDEPLFMAAMAVTRKLIELGGDMGYWVRFGPEAEGVFVTLLVDYNESDSRAAADVHLIRSAGEPRYTLTDAGRAALKGKA